MDVKKALEDLPTLKKNSVFVNETQSADDTVRIFNVYFSQILGDVPNIQEVSNFVTTQVTEVVKGVQNERNIQLIIENQAGQLFDVFDSEANIRKAIDESFGIRCPSSIIRPELNEFAAFDFEDECQPNDKPLNESAFCGKCARNSNVIFSAYNSSLTRNQVN